MLEKCLDILGLLSKTSLKLIYFQNLKTMYVKFLAALAEIGKDTIENTRLTKKSEFEFSHLYNLTAVID